MSREAHFHSGAERGRFWRRKDQSESGANPDRQLLGADYLRSSLWTQVAEAGEQKPRLENIPPWFTRKIVDNVQGVRIGNVDVISYDLDHGEPSIDPLVEQLMASPKTRIVVAEYFGPDSGRLTGWQDQISKQTHRFETLFHRNQSGYDGSTEERIAFGEQLAEVAAKHEKSVTTADVVNKIMNFASVRYGTRLAPTIPALYESAARTLDNVVPAINDFLPIVPNGIAYASAATLLWELGLEMQYRRDRGIYRRDRVPWTDKLVWDFDQARRLFLAKGVEELTQDRQFANTTEDEPGQILVLYPRAHSLRMNDHLLSGKNHPVQSATYRAIGALGNLDFSLRRWEYTGERGAPYDQTLWQKQTG